MPNRHPRKEGLWKRGQPHNEIRFCDATGLPIVCVACYRIPAIPKQKWNVCDFHRAVDEYRLMDKIDDKNQFSLPQFIEKIDWDKVQTSCQPEVAILYRQFKKTNAEIARRVV